MPAVDAVDEGVGAEEWVDEASVEDVQDVVAGKVVFGEDHRGFAKDKRDLVKAVDGGTGWVRTLGLFFEIADGSGSGLTLAIRVD